MSTQYVSVTELAARLSVSRQTIYTAIKDEELPHVRIGRAIRVSEEAVSVWIASGGATAGSGNVAGNPEAAPAGRAAGTKKSRHVARTESKAGTQPLAAKGGAYEDSSDD